MKASVFILCLIVSLFPRITFAVTYKVYSELKSKIPKSVAVLPFENLTKSEEAFDVIRKSFANHLSSKRYIDLKPHIVDRLLNQAGLTDPKTINAASVKKLGEILKVDAIIKGKITHYERTYAVAYSQVAVGAEVKMYSTKTEGLLWEASDVTRKHQGGIPLTPVGLIMTAISTAINVKQIELLRSSDDLFREIVATLPGPTLAEAHKPPSITVLVQDAVNQVKKTGDIIKVAMEGSPGNLAEFDIGDFKKGVQMKEESSGNYTGEYQVRPGENVKNAIISGRLTDENRNTVEWSDILGSVSIDTIPPVTPQGVSVVGRDRHALLSWKSNTEDDLAGYKIYRSPQPLSGFHEVSSTEFTNFEDKGLNNFTTYYYRISAFDKAGNVSEQGTAVLATPVAPGPTNVEGEIIKDTIWFAGASPYIMKSDVVIKEGSTLTIEPGTLIKSIGMGLTVRGKLIAQGAEGGIITFTSYHEKPKAGDWKGITFEKAKAEELIRYCQIKFAQKAITCLSSSPLIENNEITDSIVGIEVVDSFSTPKITLNNILSNTEDGIVVGDGAAPIIVKNNISHNGRNGILLNNSSPAIAENSISHNKKNGIESLLSTPKINHNSIQDNKEYNVYNHTMEGSPLDAMENYWGAREGALIIGRIYGRVDYHKSLDAPYPQGKPFELPILKGPLGGEIVSNAFLVLANSPYIIEKDAIIDKGATLFIEPGVVLKYNKGTVIVVKDGAIDARGRKDRIIAFTSNSSSPSHGDYIAAVRFEKETSFNSFFKYCQIRYATIGIEIKAGSPDITYSVISDNSQSGLQISGKATPKISFNTISKNTGSAGVVAIGWANPKIDHNNIVDNAFAIQSFSQILIDARNNWWGVIPPNDDLFIGENIDRSSWLNEEVKDIPD
ncbi:MAG: DUF799 family lipoprotein [Nitrospinae bacterium]|nr:DUF799 family lipoprotein [Nitrospinota bacterium]